MNKPKIAIIGYGAMGREIEKAAKERGLEITDIFELNQPIEPNKEYAFDVAVDFSFPAAVCDNVNILTKMKKNIVLGTTGWQDYKSQVEEAVIKSGVGLIYSSNFSIGMNIFQMIIEKAAKLLNNFSEYDIMVSEIHHKRKRDSPSGTALQLGEIILENLERKTNVLDTKSDGIIRPDTLHINSARIGEVNGTHTVLIDSFADSIELTHTAKNRSGLAKGAVFAAEWIHNKQGFFNFSDIINI